MSLIFNNNTVITNPVFNGTALDKVYYNGVLVFSKALSMPPFNSSSWYYTYGSGDYTWFEDSRGLVVRQPASWGSNTATDISYTQNDFNTSNYSRVTGKMRWTKTTSGSAESVQLICSISGVGSTSSGSGFTENTDWNFSIDLPNNGASFKVSLGSFIVAPLTCPIDIICTELNFEKR